MPIPTLHTGRLSQKSEHSGHIDRQEYLGLSLIISISCIIFFGSIEAYHIPVAAVLLILVHTFQPNKERPFFPKLRGKIMMTFSFFSIITDISARPFNTEAQLWWALYTWATISLAALWLILILPSVFFSLASASKSRRCLEIRASKRPVDSKLHHLSVFWIIAVFRVKMPPINNAETSALVCSISPLFHVWCNLRQL